MFVCEFYKYLTNEKYLKELNLIIEKVFKKLCFWRYKVPPNIVIS